MINFYEFEQILNENKYYNCTCKCDPCRKMNDCKNCDCKNCDCKYCECKKYKKIDLKKSPNNNNKARAAIKSDNKRIEKEFEKGPLKKRIVSSLDDKISRRL